MSRLPRLFIIIFAVFALSFGASCETFDPAPSVTLDNDVNGAMTVDSTQPLVVRFSEPVEPGTIRIKVISLDVDNAIDYEGNLLDEQSPPQLQAFKDSTVIAYDGAHPDDETRSYGGTFELDAKHTALTITPGVSLNVTVPYMLLIEPGLSDTAGNVTVPRIRLPFTYPLKGGGPTSLPSGYYYFLINVDFLAQQIRTYSYLDVDPVTGEWHGVFTEAVRRDVLNTRPGCPSSCPEATPICQLLNPALASCVKQSEHQNKLTEFPDFIPDPNPGTGFVFRVVGFARDEANGTISFGTAPFNIDLLIGATKVTTHGSVITGKFTESPTEPGRFVATGSIAVDVVQINGNDGGPTKGTLQAMTMTQDEIDGVEAFGTKVPTK